jgi:hypothetical protein
MQHCGCSTDIAPTTWVVKLPASVGAATTLTVRLRGDGIPETEPHLDRTTATPAPS